MIPAYRAGESVCAVVEDVLRYCDLVVVVDDACPQHSGDRVERAFEGNDAVRVVRHQTNGGVGRAMKSGFAECVRLGASVVIKIDADGQMDTRYIPRCLELFEADPDLIYVKGNRFASTDVLRRMPRLRLFGNAVLSLLVKFSSGYWNLLDPTNGFIAFNGFALAEMDLEQFADSYFFEISVLCALGLKNAHIAELEMHTIYGDEHSSLSIRKVVLEFPPKLFALFMRRILLRYFVFDVNLGTLYLLFGVLLSAGALALGTYEWVQTAQTGRARTAGTIMLVVLPALVGIQLFLNALLYDVQFAPRSEHVFSLRRPFRAAAGVLRRRSERETDER
ncbi:MAG TPA: glycosyltransferase family 2 protein [Candidatus Elarobacter sp.]